MENNPAQRAAAANTGRCQEYPQLSLHSLSPQLGISSSSPVMTVPAHLEKSMLGAPPRRPKASSCFCGCCWSSGLPLLFALGQKQRGSALGVPSDEGWDISFTQRSPSMTPVQPPPLPLQLVKRERQRKRAASIQFPVDQVFIQHPLPPKDVPLPERLACPVPVPMLPPRLGLVLRNFEQGSGHGSTRSMGSTATGGCASEDDILCPLSPAPADERGTGLSVGRHFSRARHNLRHRCPVMATHRVVLEETEVRPGDAMPRCPSRCCYTGSSTQHGGGRVRTNTVIDTKPALGTTLLVRGLRSAPRMSELVSEEPLPPELVT